MEKNKKRKRGENMKQTLRKKFIIILALVMCFFVVKSLSTTSYNSYADSSDVGTYTVNVERLCIRADRPVALCSRLPISNDAQKVTLEYSVVQKSGVIDRFGFSKGVMAGNVPLQSVSTFWEATNADSMYFQQNVVYKIEYNVANTDVVVSAKNSQNQDVTNLQISKVNCEGFNCATNDHFGLLFIDDNLSDANFNATLKVKIYDDKGKDLQVTFLGNDYCLK